MDQTPKIDLAKGIMAIMSSRDVLTNWRALLEILRPVGFDRVLYGKKMYVERSNLHNMTNTVLLSSYGPDLDKNFLSSRLYLNSPTILWAMEHYGAISWGQSAQQFEQGALSEEEKTVYLETRKMGLLAGYTYSVPAHTGRYRAAFGLAFRQDGTQAEADDAWAEHGPMIEPLLCTFDMSLAQCENVPDGQKLDDKTLYFMSLVAEGRSLSEIAELENCHHRTIDTRLAKARSILGAANTLQAVLIAKGQGQL